MTLNLLFQGSKEVTQEQIRKILGLNIGRPAGNFPGGQPAQAGGAPQPNAAPQYAFPQGGPGQLPMAGGPRGPVPGGMPQQQQAPQQQQQQPGAPMPSNKFLQVIGLSSFLSHSHNVISFSP